MRGSWRAAHAALPLAILASLVLTVYWPVASFEFMFIDDGAHVMQNSTVRQGFTRGGVVYAFTDLRTGANWMPLTWLSHMADVQAFGVSPGAHHFVNVLLHCGAALLLFVVLWRMTGMAFRSLVVSALFAVHPLRVESVAWIAERKDVLAACFLMLSMLAYLRYARRPSIVRYLLVVLMSGFGLMAKPILVTLPYLFLLLDFWPLGRWPLDPSPGAKSGEARHRRLFLLREKLPILFMSAAVAVVTLIAHAQAGALHGPEVPPLSYRLANAVRAYVTYLGKTAWPTNLAPFYPYPGSIPGAAVSGFVVVLGGISISALARWRRDPSITTGWLWYLGVLIPVLEVVRAGDQSMADRFTYLPHVGLFLGAVWGVGDLVRGSRWRRVAAGVAGPVIVLAFAVAARHQLWYWRDGTTLLARVVEVSPNATWMRFLYEYNAGVEQRQKGDRPGAKEHFLAALRLRPEVPEVEGELGAIALEEREPQRAVGYLREAVRLRPHDAEARNNLGVALAWVGRRSEAIAAFREAITIEPGLAAAHLHLADALAGAGELRAAEGHYREAARLRPEDADAADALGALLLRQGRAAKAIAPLERALRLKPRVITRISLAEAYEQTGARERAVAHYREALRQEPANAAAAQGLARLSR